CKEGEPARRDMGVADVPAAEIEIGKEKDDQRRRKDRFACGARELLSGGGERKNLGPEVELDADISEHRPGERGRRREHDRSLHYEKNRQEHGEQARNANDNAIVEREAVDLACIGRGLPEIELRDIRTRKLD